MNTIGYYFIFLGLEIRHTAKLNSGFDDDSFDRTAVVTIKIPVAIPYAANEAEFRRVQGKFLYQGEVFRLVKQRFSDDTLTVVCVKDYAGGKIHTALDNYLQAFNESNSGDHAGDKFSFSFMKDFIVQSHGVSLATNAWPLIADGSGCIQNFIPSYSSSIVHPPS